jgi:hypothetical protein
MVNFSSFLEGLQVCSTVFLPSPFSSLLQGCNGRPSVRPLFRYFRYFWRPLSVIPFRLPSLFRYSPALLLDKNLLK